MSLSLTSIDAVVAAHETSRNSCDFKAADVVRDHLKAQYAQQEYVQQAPIANVKLQSMSSQRQQAS